MAIRDISREESKLRNRKLSRDMKKMKSKRALFRKQAGEKKGRGLRFILGVVVLFMLMYAVYMYVL